VHIEDGDGVCGRTARKVNGARCRGKSCREQCARGSERGKEQASQQLDHTAYNSQKPKYNAQASHQ
jgi:hypothetical protein